MPLTTAEEEYNKTEALSPNVQILAAPGWKEYQESPFYGLLPLPSLLGDSAMQDVLAEYPVQLGGQEGHKGRLCGTVLS